MNLMSSALSGMVNQTAAVVLGGTVPVRLGNEHPSIYPYEPFDTGDGKLVIAIGNWRLFSALLRSLDVPLEDGVAPWPPDGRAPTPT